MEPSCAPTRASDQNKRETVAFSTVCTKRRLQARSTRRQKGYMKKMVKSASGSAVVATIAARIVLVRGQKVLLDADLAAF